MPHMIGYLAGDAETFAARKAIDNDLRLAVDFPDERRMLVVVVAQSGDITMTWTSSQGTGRVDEMYLVGKIEPMGRSEVNHTFKVVRSSAMILVWPRTCISPTVEARLIMLRRRSVKLPGVPGTG